MSLRSGIINDYSVAMGTSRFARPTRDLNWTIYWFRYPWTKFFYPCPNPSDTRASVQSPFYGLRVPWESYSVYFTPLR